MPRPGRLFLPLDVHFFDGELFEEVGEPAAVLYLAMSCKAKALMSDGVLTPGQVARIGLPKWQARLDTLLRHERIVQLDDGRYWVVAFTVHNPTAADIAMQRKKDRERKASSGRKPSPVPPGIRTDSALREKSETEKREAGNPPTDCEHGVDRNSSCRQCASSSLKVVGS